MEKTTGKIYTISSWIGSYEVRAIRANYQENGNLAIQLVNYDEEYDFWEPFGNLTVNLSRKLPENQAYVDTNNIPSAEEFIEKNGLGRPTGSIGLSGFCVYPLYEFDLDKLESLKNH